jgi:5-oxoprolinase (ATP-hydrolysing) subunit C
VIEVVKAPPFATVQDLGWRAGRAWGLPPGGAMDPLLFAAANGAVGNAPGAAAIEWALGPGALRFERSALVAVLHGVELRVNGEAAAAAIAPVPAGGTVEIVPRGADRFVYVAVSGGIAVPEVLGSRSTYLPGGFGGHEGRRLRTGDRLPLGDLPRGGGAAASPRPPETYPAGDVILRITRGPQWDLFDSAAQEAFLASSYTVASASDRMGYRLNGLAIAPREPATLPSEAACPGAVQIPDGGQPIVLMPDGPTVGGYPKIAVVIGADLRLLAQCQPGRGVRFREVSLEAARAALRASWPTPTP